jgi:hypothetical protein
VSCIVHAEVHRQFFHAFIAYASDVLFKWDIVMPTNAEEAANHLYKMTLAGFVGAVASIDATHIMMERCKHFLKQYHQGPKTKNTASMYNMSVNQRRRILYTTGGHPACWNDKTIILFDDFVRGINKGRLLDDIEFETYKGV